MELETALSLLDFACDSANELQYVACQRDVLDECELVLIVHDLIFHSLDFEDVPLVAVADVDIDFGAMCVCAVCVCHRVHCEFERLLLKSVAVFEFEDDRVAGCDAGEFGEDLLDEYRIEMRIDGRGASGGLYVVDEIHIHCDEFAVLGIRPVPMRAERISGGGGSDSWGCRGWWDNRDRIH